MALGVRRTSAWVQEPTRLAGVGDQQPLPRPCARHVEQVPLLLHEALPDTSPHRRRASAPITNGVSSHGSATRSASTGAYWNEGSSARASTSAGVTSCGIGKIRAAPAASWGSAQATTVCVVPRSMPTMRREARAARGSGGEE